MQCSKCQATIAEGVKFCPKCGARAETPAADADGKRCPQCGTENPANAKFCKKDGYRFDSVSGKPDVPDAPPAVMKPLSEPKIQETASKPIPPDSNLVTCPKCGTANPSMAKFCKMDGYPLQTAGAVSPPSAMPPAVPASTDIPLAKQSGMGSSVTPSAPMVVPQPITAKQPAPVMSRPSANVAPTAKAPIEATAAKSRKGLIISAVVGIAILASAAGGYSYWAGYIGNRQGSVQNEINAELGSHGLSNIKVTVNHDWVASLDGSVSNQMFKDQALTMVREHKELKQVVDAVQIELNAADVGKNLNKALAEVGFSSVPTVQLDKDLMATLRGSADNQLEKDRMLALAAGVAGVKGVKDEIEIAAPETIPEPENPALAELAQPSTPTPLQPQAAPQRAIDKSALDRELNARLRANGVSGVTGRVNPDMSVALSGTVRSADERYRALTIGGSLPGANGVRETIQIAAPQIIKLAPPQALLPQAQSQSPPPQQAAAIDPAKLEGDINRALRNRDVNSVAAQVNDDMSLTLKGSASAVEKERALQLARQIKGVRGIKDKIFVIE